MNWQERAEQVLIPTYRRYPLLLVRGKGTRVWDEQGREYLDFISGLASLNLGHCHPRVVSAIKEQAEKLLHTTNLFYIQPQIELAELLVENSSLDQAFFCNSGTEANESALKLARKYSREKGKGGYEIICFKNSFHGRTFGSLSATGQEKFHKGFEPLLEGFKFVEFGELEQVKSAVSKNTCAVLLEVVQGEGGVNPAPREFFSGLKELCEKEGVLLIIDEVQTGIGRLGKLFGYQWAELEPDIITLAKALGNGVPIGAMLAKKEVAKAFTPSSHASTFGGNHLACRAGKAVMEVVLEEKLWEQADRLGRYFLSQLKELKKHHPSIKEVRGVGLMLGVELNLKNPAQVIEKIREKGLLVNLTQERVVRFLPPLIVKKEEIDRALEIFDQVLKELEMEEK